MKRISNNLFFNVCISFVTFLFITGSNTPEPLSYEHKMNKNMLNAISKSLKGTTYNEIQTPKLNVTITMYHPVASQTDGTPNITADGTRFNIDSASSYNYVALSRNLLKRWGGTFEYNDCIIIKGTKDKDGKYKVKDTMHPRYVNYVDILESPNTNIYKYENVQILKDFSIN